MLLAEFQTLANLTGFHVFALMHVFDNYIRLFLKVALVFWHFTPEPSWFLKFAFISLVVLLYCTWAAVCFFSTVSAADKTEPAF